MSFNLSYRRFLWVKRFSIYEGRKVSHSALAELPICRENYRYFREKYKDEHKIDFRNYFNLLSMFGNDDFLTRNKNDSFMQHHFHWLPYCLLLLGLD